MFNVFKKVKINGIKFTFEIIQIVRLKNILEDVVKKIIGLEGYHRNTGSIEAE